MPDADPKFLQFYFMGDEEQQAAYKTLVSRWRNEKLWETVWQNHNQLLRLFKTLSKRLQNDNYVIVIKVDKMPYGEHAGTYNIPTINEVAIVTTGDPTERRDICIQRRDKFKTIFVLTMHCSIP
ncbi:uncharacterized protein TNCV_4303101 [Trichonephila clavipes]|nr:uncharacterized protein TNCV_4303101 [Trichonephila clavipes]